MFFVGAVLEPQLDMRLPIQITYRNMRKSDAVDKFVRAKAAELEKRCSDLMGCRVAVEAPHRHQRLGNLYHVRVYLTVSGGELVAGRDPALHHAHEDVFVAVRDAFRATRRELMDYVRERRGQVKSHEEPSRGRVTKLFPEEGYGFITTRDGRELYFHQNSVIGDFTRLARGALVRFAEEIGEKGPQASTVQWIRGPGAAADTAAAGANRGSIGTRPRVRAVPR
jgi:cold shock CspA family protein/ribosome-associated translation inhibitor RaiA